MIASKFARTGIALATFASAFVAHSSASARCSTPQDFVALGKSVSTAVRCRQRQLRSGSDAGCLVPAEPACGGTLVEDVLAVAFADVARVTNPSLLRCQDAIARGARTFVRRRLRERGAGERRQRRSRRTLERVARRCAVVSVQGPDGMLPAVGGACAGAVGAPGTPVDPGRLAGCLRPVLERLVDGVAPEALQPNIVVVLTDDQRWDTLGVMPRVQGEIAGKGVSFANSFVTTSLCCPSRASLYSGQYAHHHGVLTNGPPEGGAAVFPDDSTLPVWLSEAGYATALFGKYMNGNDAIAPAVPPGWSEWQTFVEDGGAERGTALYYDYTLNENGTLVAYGHTTDDYSTDLLAARVLRFITAKADRPFFAVYAPTAPHEPAIAAERHLGRFAGIEPWRPPNWCEPDVTRKPRWVRFQATITTPEGIANTDASRTRQLETLLAVDEAVGRILAKLERLGLTDQTLVAYTSDNGYHWREHWWNWKLTAYEEAIRVPLAVRLPVLVPLPRAIDALALNIDLAPTFVELAGRPIPASVDGRSLLGALAGAPWRDDFLFEHWGTLIVKPNVGIRTTRWKYIRTTTDGFEELYDLAADPYELENRAGDPAYANVQGALTARLTALLAE